MSAADRLAAEAADAPQLGSPQEIVLTRHGDRDLKFAGWRIAYASSRRGGHVTEIEIYATVGQRLITRITGYDLGYSTPHNTLSAAGLSTVAVWTPVVDEAHMRRLMADGIRLEREDERVSTGVHENGEAALAWLKRDNKGGLGSLSKAAWAEACSAWRPLNGMQYETVE